MERSRNRTLLGLFATAALAGTLAALPPVSGAEEPRPLVTVDPRLELLAVVQRLSGYPAQLPMPLLTPFDFRYVREVEARFAPYRDHEAVRLFADMCPKGFAMGAPPELMLHFSDPPALEPLSPVGDFLRARAGGDEAIARFLAALRRFAVESRFESFRDEHRVFYGELVRDTEQRLDLAAAVQALEGYCGARHRRYHVILAPLVHGNHGPLLEPAPGQTEAYCIMGTHSVRDDRPRFQDHAGLLYLVWHEMGHSFVNPLGQQHREAIAGQASLFEGLSAAMYRNGYSSWPETMDELVNRAVTIRLHASVEGAVAAEQVTRDELASGFAHIRSVTSALERYEQQRDRFPTLASFYPEILAALDGEVQRQAALAPGPRLFRGPIAAVFEDASRLVIVTPTAEPDVHAQAQILNEIQRFRDAILPAATVLTDREALTLDLSGRSIMVVGTPQGNLWLARLMDRLPLRVLPDRVEAGQIFRGDRLRAIATCPNPGDPSRGVVVYTAQRTADLLGIGALQAGPFDFLVAQGASVLGSGHFEKTAGGWRPASPAPDPSR